MPVASRTPLSLASLPHELFPETWAALEQGAREGVAPGFVAGLWRANEPDLAWVAATGFLRTFPAGVASPPMGTATVFDLSSVSKVIATVLLVGRLVDRGWMRFEDPIRAYLPEFPHAAIRLRHLLSHTSGLPACIPLWQRLLERAGAGRLASAARSPDVGLNGATALLGVPIAARQRWAREIVTATPLERPIGERAVYSDVSFLLLGFAVEEVLGMALDRAVARYVWKPMGVDSAFYRRLPGPCPAPLETIAPTENCPWRKRVLQGEVHDDNAWAMGGYAGHAGVFGDARAVLTVARSLFLGDFLTRETLRAMWTRVADPVGCTRTLGWDTPSGDNPSPSRLFSPSSVGHLGFTGTSLWIDPDAGLAVTLLCNRVHPTRGTPEQIPPPLIRAFRPVFHAAIRRDLVRTKPV